MALDTHGGTAGTGTTSPDVGDTLAVQQWLLAHGYDPGPIDGIDGPQTQAALTQFQYDSGVTTDGVYGTQTQSAMDNFVSKTAGIPEGQGGNTGGGTGGGTGDSTSAPSGASGSTGGSTGGTAGGTTTTTAPATSTGSNTDGAVALHILTGRNMSWYHDTTGDRWYVGYGLESGRSLVFEATNAQMDALFGQGGRPAGAESVGLQTLLGRTGVTFGGSIAEMEGTGTFESEVARVTALALDEGVLPDWAKKDGAAMDIIFEAQSEGKSTQWVLDQLAGLPSFEERFPGLNDFRKTVGLSLDESITGFLDMETGIKKSLLATGQDPSVVSPQVIGDLLSKGYSLTDATNTIQGFDRMKKFAPAMDAFNSILQAQGMDTISSMQDMLDFVSGEAPSQMYDVWEASSIAEAAKQAGLGDVFTPEDAIRIGLATDQNLKSATQASQKAAELLLRLRHEVDVNRFGLNSEDLIDISFGTAPRSGASMAEVNDNINRAILSAQAFIKTKSAQPYKSFGPTGALKNSSLGTLRQTS